jgi:hypothetical protein
MQNATRNAKSDGDKTVAAKHLRKVTMVRLVLIARRLGRSKPVC